MYLPLLVSIDFFYYQFNLKFERGDPNENGYLENLCLGLLQP